MGKMTAILSFVFLFSIANAEVYERTRILKRNGNCVYAEHYWTGGFSERYSKGWVCAEGLSTRGDLEERMKVAREYLENPANRPEILSQRIDEILKFQSEFINKWQKQCGENVKGLYDIGVFDYKRQFNKKETCENIDNLWSFKCLNSLFSYQYSPFGDQYEHNRRDAVTSCGTINSEERYRFLEFLYKRFVEYNKDSDKIILLPTFYITKGKYIKNKYNRECIEEVLQRKDGIQKFAEVCSEINNQTALIHVKSLVRTNPNFTENEILILSE